MSSAIASHATVASVRPRTSVRATQPAGLVAPARALTSRPRASVSMSRGKQVILAASSMEEQTKAMNEAERRWQANVRSGRVRSVSAREAMEMVNSGEWKMLDVRPFEERENGEVPGSVTVELFQVDDDMSPSGLLKQMSAFGMGGWWLGGQHMKPNEKFMPEVLNKMPTDTKVVVTCQKGLRSLAACEQLSRAGFENIAWLNGGFEAAEKEVIPSKDGKDIRLAGVGGLSGVLGWNPVQQKEGVSTMDGPFGNVIKIAGFLIALDALAFLYELANAQ